ncbi:MAG: phosphotransferase family protein [Rhodobiaceae bacterium]|nr:phosphotransferase family protein [Rhodobiaceae bacterium]MCC0056873.1 phosphotransferase family protein [Rhodobiaceae bacterium]
MKTASESVARVSAQTSAADLRQWIRSLESKYEIEPRLNALLNERLLADSSGAAFSRPTVSEIKSNLRRFLASQLGEDFTLENMSKMSGGAGNETYKFELVSGDSSQHLILRVKAPGACCDTHIPSEYQAMKAVEGFLPIPEPLWLIRDSTYFGGAALICRFLEGVQAPPSESLKASAMGAVFGDELRRELAPQFIEYEAKLHSFDWARSNLTEFAKPRPGTTDAIDWRLAFWDRVWEQDLIEEHPTMILSREWLEKHKPVADHISLLHGDFRNGNFLYDQETSRITGILDWELCSLGDRHCDLGYTMLPAWGHDDANGEFLNAGLATLAEFTRIYERQSGLKIDPERLHYYIIFNIWWSAVALLGTALTHAAARRTQMDVLYNLISGKGGYDICDLNRMIVEN